MENHQRFGFSPISRRRRLEMPGGARIAVWVIPNIEHFHFDKPSTSITPITAHLKPDVLNYAWRDFGNRVGVWRLMDIMERHGFKGTAALNAEVCEYYPEIIDAGNKLGWEWMAHGRTNSELLNGQSEEQERVIVKSVVDTIALGTGVKPKGWLGPALTESHNTPDILAENGIEYLCDWCNDEQPYEFNVRNGKLISVPYSIEVNDIPAFLDRGMSPEQFGQMIVDQFDVLYADGERNPRIMAVCLHPFLIGHGFRAKYLEKAFEYISKKEKVWISTGGEISDWYYENYTGK
ncbi:polysaccharide deacetylase [Mesorhizobium sp. L-8-10]|uniref:polysaccharide deacetylase family protein n=1 Tax=Mesorhizobium sp. L-8-10 TaxID=2744523 RepID=UPI001926EBDD|nr:polysaccharide deacetylase family protein [Mesorhizobium sp. L-8-10]BCH29370.1 polysaccharide deacetylase [Mesorhizobium sp. L-8-10]